MEIIMRRIIFSLISCILLFGILGCGSVPKEVVELSYTIGKDLVSIQKSYDSLIHQFYENLRSQRRQYLDDIWYPRFLSNWRDDGQLIAIAKKEKIWSAERESLIPAPRDTTEKEHLDTLNDWVNFALYAYEVKEEELLKPLNDEENELRKDVNNSLNRLIKANAAITAHLNSLREVQEVQDDVLKALDIEDLREKINSTLVKASNGAQDALNKIKDADSKINNLANSISQ
jgi:DNA repair ATPase RecN